MILPDQSRRYFTSPLLTDRVFHGFGTKELGNGQDIEIVRCLLSKNNKNCRFISFAQQNHSVNINVITKRNGTYLLDSIANYDALITQEREVLLAITTADCVPIIYFDNDHSILGVSHGGWRGTLNSISTKVIQMMEKFGANKKQMNVVIGPAIGKCCYEITGQRYIKFLEYFGDKVFYHSKNKVYLDLIKTNIQSLINHGICKDNIDIASECTSCNGKIFWSYHRDKKLDGQMLNFAMLL